jgi:MFS family permease
MTVGRLHSSSRFGLLYATANVGAFICFIPLVTLILPQRAIEIAPDAAVKLLSWTLLVGGIASSIANISAGWLSDRLIARQGSRMPLVGVGLALTMVSLAALSVMTSAAGLILCFIFFQFAFNTLFSPFNTLAADHIPDRDKGRIFGWLSLGLPLSQIVVLGLVWLRLDAPETRLGAVACSAALLLMPLLIFGRRIAGNRIAAATRTVSALPAQRAAIDQQLRRDFGFAWVGRFFIQCAAVGAGAFMLIHLSTVLAAGRGGAIIDDLFGTITFISLGTGLSVGLLVGIWSDRSGRRRPFIYFASLLVAIGFLTMSLAVSWVALVAGYSLFAIGFAGFLTIDGAIIAEIVGNGEDRARRLGVINLSNTLPTIFVPGLSLTIERFGATPTPTLFACIAAGALISAWSTSRIRSIS